MKINDKFYPTPLPKLLKIILNNLKDGHVLGLPKELFFRPKDDDFFKTEFFGHKIDAPIGVAAGPHTQLSQNIVVAWLAGARFIELKTVQTLDELDISKPCIDMQEEGYNCEWSQELKIYQAFEQYLDAWILIHILANELGLEHHGAIFNMSIGYDFKGIMQDNVQWFLNKMTDASDELQRKIEQIRHIYPQIDKLNIPTKISDNITLSTMHGCPPEEVEQIANYLLTERKLHTIIKLNPTLLGPDMIRQILKDSGFKAIVPDKAFEHDLKFYQAVEIVKRLRKKAKELGLFFGIKLTNTLEVLNHKGYFADEEMYMSGNALHPISINLARKFQNYFNGELDISFSGGVNAFNVVNVLKSGLKPITVSSDLLKPGGYGRLAQYYENLRTAQKDYNLKSIDDLINYKHSSANTRENALKNLNEYADLVLISPAYKKKGFKEISIKSRRKLGEFDCIFAPCQNQCPTSQDVPQYMYHVSRGEYDAAFLAVLEDNPFPSVLGYSCDHTCQLKCTRINYDEALHIREIKRFIADYNSTKSFNLPVRKVAKTGKVAIVGGGPGGLSAAFFLKLYGFEPEIFEATGSLGGMIAKALPLFRLPAHIVHRDIQRILDLGIKVHYNRKLNFEEIKDLLNSYDAVIMAVGAMKSMKLGIEGEDAEGVWDPLEFFYITRKKPYINIGKKVAVIGGGNSAMDAARIAKRLVGKDGEVYILYRRTREYMPAQDEEILEALVEGVKFIELVQPVRFITKNGKVVGIELVRTKLEKSEKGKRPKPVPIPNSNFVIEVDAVIPAIGQLVEEEVVPKKITSEEIIPKTKFENLYIIGDAAHGGFSIVAAVGEGKLAAYDIIRKFNPDFSPYKFKPEKKISYKELKLKRYRRIAPEEIFEIPSYERHDFSLIIDTMTPDMAQREADRCLLCDELCDICTTVCPNMANQHYNIEPFELPIQTIQIQNSEYQILETKTFAIKQKYQTLNIADWCNECGNCTTFCPTAGKPYVDKPKVHLSWNSYTQSPFGYYVQNNTVYYKDQQQGEFKLTINPDSYYFETKQAFVKLDKNFQVVTANSTSAEPLTVDLSLAVKMKVIAEAIKQILG